jgi:F0F1-type ATP synthase assembly protein I
MQQNDETWKRQSLVIGTVAGAIIGAFSSYLFNRATEEEIARQGGQPAKIQTGQLLGLALALLAVIRQITELGKTDKKRR